MKEYKTKCDECSPTSLINLAQFAVGNNTYSFTSRYTCIQFSLFVNGGVSSGFQEPGTDVFGNGINLYIETIVITDLDRQASPSSIVGYGGISELIMHKHSNGYNTSIPSKWNLQIYILGNSGPTYTGAITFAPSYRNINYPCI